jgi:hypothetical protein
VTDAHVVFDRRGLPRLEHTFDAHLAARERQPPAPQPANAHRLLQIALVPVAGKHRSFLCVRFAPWLLCGCSRARTQQSGVCPKRAARHPMRAIRPGAGSSRTAGAARDIARQLIESGHVTNSHRAALGAQVTTATGPDGAPAGAGIVAVTSGGPADKAGLRSGDVITAAGTDRTPDDTALSQALAAAGQTTGHPGYHPWRPAADRPGDARRTARQLARQCPAISIQSPRRSHPPCTAAGEHKE